MRKQLTAVIRAVRRARSTAALLFAVALAVAAPASPARADGDPGSDVLVYQDLFAGVGAGLSVRQQLELGGLLKSASQEGFPIRVAIIASRFDLGAVTVLWRNPRAYARFLGLELSLAYKRRLLVVMPNGFGFNWPGHSSQSAYRLLAGIPISSGGSGLIAAAQKAVRELASAGGVSLPGAANQPGRAEAAGAGTGSAAGAVSRHGTSSDDLAGIVALCLIAAAALVMLLGRAPGPRIRARTVLASRRPRLPGARPAAILGGALLALGAIAAALTVIGLPTQAQSQGEALASNPSLDPGTPLSGRAPDFTLANQFGQPVSLHSFRGKVVIVAFNDSECTTMCPLTTTAMLDAKAMLGKAASQVQLLGVDANPAAISLEDVWSYSELHGMLHAWQFLTGTLPQLKQVWHSYAVEAAVERGQITHTPALFVIDPQGRKAKVYITQMSFTAVPQLGQLLAHDASNLLPGHPAVHSSLSYARVQSISPSQSATLPHAGGGDVRLGRGSSARLFVFFATWDQETSALGGQLDALNRYQQIAARSGLPQLTAVDEASVEPNANTLSGFLRRLPQPLSYPVGIDGTGKVADGYEVLGLPWFVLVSATGRFLYYREVSTAGWPSTGTLIRYVKAALARAPEPAAPTRGGLAGSPPPLAALHEQAGRLLGDESALAARIRALRGYPIVVNAWASWCPPCREEFGLFASASARLGRHIAFLGADTNDSATDARTFLAQHAVDYPSYQTATTNLSSLAAVEGLPATIFINPGGKVVYVHTGQYDAQGTLDQDIESYAAPASAR